MEREYYHLKNVDAVDINDVLLKVQRSFDIRFDQNEVGLVASFSDLCSVIQRKISLEHEDTCTTQHAFYLLRNVISATTGIERYAITPHGRLSRLLSRENTLEIISDIERQLGFGLNLLRPKQGVIATFTLALFASAIAFLFSWPIALGGCLASISGLKLAGKFGKEIHLKTVGDLANKISRESYIKARRNPTVNRDEIEQKVRELFDQDLQLEPAVITRRSRF